ncbi:pyruvate kinase [Agrobacterium sp. a22-2]|uniref:pyruvate kinase n=1 Tax=Agrobacterium sp. a22-2 TaxID=2283840 RepID=UPI00144698DC|nr:pyruvate kinase [Agrobacterium sp. a22-2]NKN34916.1 pyruvate kinase [Agrobacterium sp. a22-2]
MNKLDVPTSAEKASDLLDEMLQLRATVLEKAAVLLAGFDASTAPADPAVENLSHYLSLRHHDLRILQRRLMVLGLSSLGRLEGRVLPTLDAVIAALAALSGRESPVAMPTEGTFFKGETRLQEAADALFAAPRAHRRTRIMVTLPSEAANEPDFILDLAAKGMDIARINCAHDGPDAWRAMSAHVRSAANVLGRDLKVLMDIAGPKIRTGVVELPDKKARLSVGDRVRLVASGLPRTCGEVRFSAGVSLPEMVTRLSVGDRLRYDDGKLEGVVDSTADGEAVILITKAKSGGAKLKPEKGINLPDTALGLSPLTAKDETDLPTVIECADMIGYSFVSHPDDIDLLDAALARHGATSRPLGLIAKIEQPDAVRNLPALIARARRRGPFGVMIARGDLAAEIGFERLAEMQEEILWICEAASVPAIWATQVLEDLVRDGIPSRGEMTDAAMAGRAECVMLNKGPSVGQAVELLDRLLGRMDEHVVKKTPTLRALKSW